MARSAQTNWLAVELMQAPRAACARVPKLVHRLGHYRLGNHALREFLPSPSPSAKRRVKYNLAYLTTGEGQLLLPGS